MYQTAFGPEQARKAHSGITLECATTAGIPIQDYYCIHCDSGAAEMLGLMASGFNWVAVNKLKFRYIQ